MTLPKNGLSTTSTITVVIGTVLADGTTGLPDGTTRWTVAPNQTADSSWFEAPIYTHRIDGTGPDVFMAETNTTTWETTLRAISASGEADWLTTAPGIPLMGDMYGGVVAGVEPALRTCQGVFNEVQRCYKALVRFAGPAGTAPWRYDSPGLVDRPAQGPDGTIYVVEHTGDYLYQPNNTGNAYFPYPGEKTMVILDGATGAVTARVPLEGDPDREPVTVGPIVGGDGFGYLLVTKGMRLTLHRLSRDGPVATEVIVDGTCTSNCVGPVPYQLVPDGVGGLLITATWHVSSTAPYDFRLTRLGGAGGRTDTPIASGTRLELIGQAGTAYLTVTSGTTLVSQPVVDVTTGAPRGYLPLGWTWLAARPDGGVLAENAAGDIGWFDETGQLLETAPAPGLQNPVQALGGLVGTSGRAPNSAYGLRMVAWRGDDATYWDATRRAVLYTQKEQYGFGYRTGQNAPQPSYSTREEAALRALDVLYKLSAAANYEYGGLICQQASRFVWSRFVTDFNQSRVTVRDSLCLPGTLAAHMHVHPPIEPGSAPSDPRDYDNADAHPGIPYYLRTPALGLPMPATTTTKYWNSITRTARENLCLLAGTTWIPYVPSSGAICATPQP